MIREQAIEELKQTCVLRGDFVLRSGRHSKIYMDKFRIGAVPELLSGIGGLLAVKITQIINVDMRTLENTRPYRIAAPELGAVPIAAVTAIKAVCPLLLVRKEAKTYGNLTGSPVEGVYNPADRIIVIEDVITTGGAVLQAIKALETQKLNVVAVLCVLDRQEGGREAIEKDAGYPFHSLFTSTDLGMKEAS